MSSAINDDYSRFKKEIEKSVKPLYKITTDIEPLFKKHHKSMYVIALFIAKHSKLKEEHKKIFLAEILSDFLTLTKLLFIGFETPSLIVLRRITENFYNHIFYFDHPIEYTHLNNGKNEYTPIDKMKLYFDTHPVFFDTDDVTIKEYNQMLFNEYHLLCKVVHSKGKDAMNLVKQLKDLTEEFDIKKNLSQLINIELYIIYLLYKFHRNIKFAANEKAVFLSLIPANKRSHIHD